MPMKSSCVFCWIGSSATKFVLLQICIRTNVHACLFFKRGNLSNLFCIRLGMPIVSVTVATQSVEKVACSWNTYSHNLASFIFRKHFYPHCTLLIAQADTLIS